MGPEVRSRFVTPNPSIQVIPKMGVSRTNDLMTALTAWLFFSLDAPVFIGWSMSFRITTSMNIILIKTITPTGIRNVIMDP